MLNRNIHFWLVLDVAIQFKSRTSLRFLDIAEFPTRDTAEPDGNGNRGLTFHHLTVEDLPSSLELFGNRADIYPILRDSHYLGEANSDANASESPSRAFGPCCSLEKIAFRTVEDFGCADWEWLLRWHEFIGRGTSIIDMTAEMVVYADAAWWTDAFRTAVLKHGVVGPWIGQPCALTPLRDGFSLDSSYTP